MELALTEERNPFTRDIDTLPTLDMLSCLAHATGSTLRLAAPGVGDVDLGGAA